MFSILPVSARQGMSSLAGGVKHTKQKDIPMSKIKKDDSIFIVVPKGVIHNPNLSPSAKIIWQTLASMDIGKKKSPFPSLKFLGEVIGASTRASVIKYLDELEKFGCLKKRRRFGKTSLYEIDLPEMWGVQKMNMGSSKNEQLPVQKLNTKEHKGKEHKRKTEDVNVKGQKKLQDMKRAFGLD